MDFCLLCLEMRNSPDDGIHVESVQWQEEKIAQLIDKHFWTMKSLSNTAWLCITCWQTISEFHKFYIRVENAHACFTTALKTEMEDRNQLEKMCTGNELRIATRISNDAQLDLEMPIEMVPNVIEPALLFDTVSRKEENQVGIKTERETKDQEEHSEIEKPTRRKSLRIKDPLKKSVKTRKCKRLTNKKNEETPSNDPEISDKDGSIDSQDKDTTSDNELYKANKSDSDIPSDVDSKGKSRSRPCSQTSTKYKGQDEFVATNFKLNCGICQARLNTFHEVCKHSAGEHKQRGFVSCCNKMFFRRSVLVEHIHWHLDPEYFKCKDCGKIMADRRCLQVHSRMHKQKDRTHICDECGKAFATALALERHKLIHLPDEQKKYTCNQCGKNFGDNNLLSNHKRSVHLKKYVLVCDICGCRMRSKDVFERHMLKHKGLPIPTVSCDVCGLKMTDPRFLKRHKEVQHPEGGRVEYKCHLCSKVSTTLKAHKRHVQYKHELGYDFKCTVCEKAFKRAIALREHMATHTGTVLYTCPYCPKTFNSNANMHNHRKKHHPKEWEEACRAKYSGNLPPNYKPTTALSF